MIIKKLGVLLLAVIIGLTLSVTPAIYATQNNTCPPCQNMPLYRQVPNNRTTTIFPLLWQRT